MGPTVNVHLPEELEPIPVQVGSLGALYSTVAELLGVPFFQVSLCLKAESEHMIEIDFALADELKQDEDVYAVLTQKRPRQDPPGTALESVSMSSPKAIERGSQLVTSDDEEWWDFQPLESSNSTTPLGSSTQPATASGARDCTDLTQRETVPPVPDKLDQPDEDDATGNEDQTGEGSPGATGRPQIDMTKFQDPIQFVLFADPVVLSDGNTYDREIIEQYIEIKIQAARNQQAGVEEGGDGTCCGRQSKIELTSPLTGEVVSSVLVPNRHVEQQVVEYVGAGLFDLSPDDLADWHERRENKRAGDKIRQEHRQMEEAAEAQRRQNAARAQELRDAERQGGDVSVPTIDNPATAFRIVQNTSDDPRVLGLAVPLCGPEAKMERKYFASMGPQPRCLVRCCTDRLSDNSEVANCDRCGQVACGECLDFIVSDYNDASNSPSAHVCTECVMQLTDSMPRDGEAGRLRAVIVRTKLRTRLDAILRRASALVDQDEANSARQQYSARIQELENEIRALENTQRGLESDIQEAETAAQQARDDSGDGVDEKQCAGTERTVEQLGMSCRRLQRELDILLDERSSGDEGTRFERVRRISDVRHRLEEATLALGSAMSRDSAISKLSARSAVKESDPTETKSVAELQSLLIELEMELQCNSAAQFESDAAATAHMVARSKLTLRIEKLQNQLLRKLSDNMVDSSPSVTDNAAVDERLELLQQEYFALTQQLGTTSDPVSLVVRISELEATLNEAQSSMDINTEGGAREDTFGDWWASLGGEDEEDWPLPLGLDYPSQCMVNHIELLKTQLNQTKLQRQEHHETRFNAQIDELQVRKDNLEDSIARLRVQATSAQETAAQEEERRAARRERHQREQAARRRREQERLEQERRIRAEQARLRAKHEQDEAATREALRRAVGTEGNARLIGGRGDLRMCRHCKAGPVENMACSDLEVHNDTSTTYKGTRVASTSNPNSCPNCGRFEAHWHRWLKWDGIEGPH